MALGVSPVVEARAASLTARVNLRSWTRRYRRGRLEPLDSTAARVLAHVQSLATQWAGAGPTLREPALVREGIPQVYLVGLMDFWMMVQRTDLGPAHPGMLYVMVHRRTLADPWECTCLLTAKPF